MIHDSAVQISQWLNYWCLEVVVSVKYVIFPQNVQLSIGHKLRQHCLIGNQDWDHNVSYKKSHLVLLPPAWRDRLHSLRACAAWNKAKYKTNHGVSLLHNSVTRCFCKIFVNSLINDALRIISCRDLVNASRYLPSHMKHFNHYSYLSTYIKNRLCWATNRALPSYSVPVWHGQLTSFISDKGNINM